MVIDLDAALLEPVLVFTRRPAELTGARADAFSVWAGMGCWREMPSRSVDNAGGETLGASLRLQIPDAGEFAPLADYLAGEGLWSLSRGDYVARGKYDEAAQALRLADGFVMPYAVTDGFAINAVAKRVDATIDADTVLRVMRRHGGKAVRAWSDCRRPASAPGAAGRFVSMLHVEA